MERLCKNCCRTYRKEAVRMAVRIVTDSASDIPQTLAAKWNIRVLPLKIRFEEEEYLDGVTITPPEFYEKMVKADRLPKTSLIPPFEYEAVFEEAVHAGDEVVCLCMSSGVSGAYQSACVAAADYQDHVHVIDTKQFCVSELIIVERAVQLRDEGLNAAEIAAVMRKELKEAHVVAVFDTLEYLRKGGRLSRTAAIAGEMLSIKPIITIKDGKIVVLGKARGVRRGWEMLSKEIEANGGVDFGKPILLGYTGLSDQQVQKYAQDSASLWGDRFSAPPTAAIGSVIGTHAGPGAFAAAFFRPDL